MKIRTKITLWLLLTALLIPAACWLALATAQHLERQMQAMAATDNLLNNLSRLRMVAVEISLYQNERAKDQWQKQIEELQQALLRLPVGQATQQARVARFARRIELVRQTYARLDHLSARASKTPEGAELLARSITGLFALTQEMRDIGREMIADSNSDAKQALEVMQGTVLVIILALAALVYSVWRLIRHDVLTPLERIEQVTQKVAAGDYSWQLNFPQKDEIGALANTFDQMTGNVRQAQQELVATAEKSAQAEVALAESLKFNPAILDNAGDCIITIDKLGNIGSVNLAVTAIFGYAPDELLGKNVSCLMPEPYHSQHHQYLRQYHATGIAKIIGIGREVEGRRKNGECFPMDLRVTHTTYHGADLFVGVIRDISERKRVERMQAEFVSTVSHELRTPLTSINGALGLTVGGALGAISPKIHDILTIAHKNGLRLGQLIDDLLDVEKLAAGKFKFEFRTQPLMPLIDLSLENSAPYAARLNVRYQLLARQDQVQVHIDGHRLQQVMSNLLSNAAKFSPGGGQVDVSVSLTGHLVRVAVTDHGPGIPGEFQERIFQKFSQADASDTRAKGGTGLGLAISKELIERMGGQIGFETAPGAGSCFYFALPVVDAAPG